MCESGLVVAMAHLVEMSMWRLSYAAVFAAVLVSGFGRAAQAGNTFTPTGEKVDACILHAVAYCERRCASISMASHEGCMSSCQGGCANPGESPDPGTRQKSSVPSGLDGSTRLKVR
jgi:hypothetical protein